MIVLHYFVGRVEAIAKPDLQYVMTNLSIRNGITLIKISEFPKIIYFLQNFRKNNELFLF